MFNTDICVIFFFSRSRNNKQRQFYSTQRHKTNMTQIHWRVEWRRVMRQRKDAVSQFVQGMSLFYVVFLCMSDNMTCICLNCVSATAS